MNISTTRFNSCESETLKESMRDSVVCFCFVKSDGSHRVAYGTLSSKIIDEYYPPSSSSGRKSSSPGLISYFDIEKLQWRSFAVERLLGVDVDYAL